MEMFLIIKHSEHSVSHGSTILIFYHGLCSVHAVSNLSCYLLNMGQKQRYSKENSRIIPHIVAPRNSKKENIILFNVKFPLLNLRQMAKSVEVLDKGPTTNVFLGFASCSMVPRYIGSLQSAKYFVYICSP